jgi:hypothetical protein
MSASITVCIMTYMFLVSLVSGKDSQSSSEFSGGALSVPY